MDPEPGEILVDEAGNVVIGAPTALVEAIPVAMSPDDEEVSD